MEPKTQYTIRRIGTAEEMQVALELRYTAYSKTFPDSMDKNSGITVEVDAYDLNAIHFGLFDDANGELAGYFRLLFDLRYAIPARCQPHSMEVLEPARRALNGNDNSETGHPLFISGIVSEGEKEDLLSSWVDQRSVENAPMTEVSRLIITEEHRGNGVSKAMIAAMFALFPYMDMPFAIFCCDPEHVRVYQRYGMDIVAGGIEFNNEVYGLKHVMYGQYQSYSPAFKKMIEHMVAQYRRTDSCKIMARV